MTELLDNSVQKLWQCQPVEVTKMSAETLRKRANKLERRVWWRNAREYAAAVIGIAMWGSFFFKTHELSFRIAFALFIAGILWVVVQLHRKASARSIPFGTDTSTSLRLYRVELERQRDALKNVWSWYLAPLVPAFAVFTVVDAVANPYVWKWTRLTLLDVCVAAMFFGIWKLNQGAARRLQRMIDEINGVAE
ncbi:MAG TPA: hypothetical protein VGS27_28510 [Candidatus Sulfotelmatobacter sp.]|nr:hypothetical protein [Candidatus Sulfotelmatobacter sp.]